LLFFAACPQSGTDTGSDSAAKPPAKGGQTQASGWTGNARDFAFSGYNGADGRLSDFAGKPVVVNFWATW